MERPFEIELDVEEPPDIHHPVDPPLPPPEEPTGGGGGREFPPDPALPNRVFWAAIVIFCFFGALTVLAILTPASGGLAPAIFISTVFAVAYMLTLWAGARWMGVQRRG